MVTVTFPDYELRPHEVAQLQEVIGALRHAEDHPTAPGFYDRHWTALQHLPGGLRMFLESIRRAESTPAVLVHGFPTDEALVSPTPPHWDAVAPDKSTLDHEIYLALCGMALGEPFTWATLQDGRLVQDILPIAGDEVRQSGHGSEALLEFHTEDAFHPDRCDYLLLFGLRNPDRVPTIVAPVREVQLSPDDRRILAERRYYLVPDDEHVRQLQERDPDHPALREMRRMLRHPTPEAVLFGDPARPYLRLDRPFMFCAEGDLAATAALDHLMAELQRVARDVVVDPGTLLVFDNYAAAHGRRSFRCRHDGTDRWLKKLVVRRDLRRRALSGSHRVLV